MFDSYPENVRELLKAASLHRVTELAIFQTKPNDDTLNLIHHIRPDAASEGMLAAAKQAFADIVGQTIDIQHDTVVRVSAEGEPGLPQFCLVLLSLERPTPAAAAAFILRCRDIDHASAALGSLRAETPLFRSGGPLDLK